MITSQPLEWIVLVGLIGKVLDWHTHYLSNQLFSHTLGIQFHYQIIILHSSSFSSIHAIKLVHYHVTLKANTFNSFQTTYISTYHNFWTGIFLSQSLCHHASFFLMFLHIKSKHMSIHQKLRSLLGEKNTCKKTPREDHQLGY